MMHRGIQRCPLCRAITSCTLWELRMVDLLPLLRVTPGLKSALLGELHDAMTRMAKMQPDDHEWADIVKLTEECQSTCAK